jgi:hypothetical protein
MEKDEKEKKREGRSLAASVATTNENIDKIKKRLKSLLISCYIFSIFSNVIEKRRYC